MTESAAPAPVTNPAAQRLAARLRQLRQARGLPRRELARVFACSISLIEKIERAERAPDRSLVAKYEKTFTEATDLRVLWSDMDAERQTGQERLAAERQDRQPPTPQAGSWRSNTVDDGSDTTRAAMPRASSSCCAAIASDTSEPVARITAMAALRSLST